MVPKSKVENLLVAGRNASSEDGAESSILCSGISMALGEAAGTACALSVAQNISPREINVKTLQEALIAHGAILDPVSVPKVENYPVYQKV
ncbi:MAG: FAD-dependent oxidoreductase, partial [Eubacteriales bacterium]